MADGRHFEER